MQRKIVATVLILFGVFQIGTTAAAPQPELVACQAICGVARNSAPGVRDAMAEGVARIAVRAALPKAHAAPLTRQDWLGLYVLLSLQGRTKTDQP